MLRLGWGFDNEYKWISTKIERQIKRDRKKSLKEVKILVLEAAESGKSTFTKQMKVIQGSGFYAFEREESKEIILSNLLISTSLTRLGLQCRTPLRS